MRAYVYLNDGDDHWDGWKPEHMGALHLAGYVVVPDGEPVQMLEKVFQFCNGMDPQSDVGWYAHGFRSLSVGDVVLLEADGAQVAWACERSGWKRLPAGVLRVIEVSTRLV